MSSTVPTTVPASPRVLPIHSVDGPSGWDILASLSGVIGVIIALVALAVALVQMVKAKRDLEHERRTVFELEVLRDLLAVMETLDMRDEWLNARKILAAGRARVEMLPDHALPFWRAFIAFGESRARELDQLGYNAELSNAERKVRHEELAPEFERGRDRLRQQIDAMGIATGMRDEQRADVALREDIRRAVKARVDPDAKRRWWRRDPSSR